MLKVVWIPAVAAAPDASAYRQAVDTLTASYHDDSATAHFPRVPDAAPSGIDDFRRVVEIWLAARSVPTAPAKLMVHGFDFDPRHNGDPQYDPFTGVYGYPVGDGPDPRLSWLPLVEEYDPATRRLQETAIAFAWVSTGSMAEYATAGWGESYEYACIDLVGLAATALAGLLDVLATAHVSVDVLAHSLGTRLFTQAVRLRANDAPLNNVILLDGAEFSVDAAAVFKGRGFSVVNVTNEVDAVLAAGGEQLGDPSRVPGTIASCCVGRFGLGTAESWNATGGYPRNWADIALDRRDVQAWFKANGGYTLTPTSSDNVHPMAHMNHWACYTEPGNRAWVTDLLWKPAMNGAVFAAEPSLPKGVLGPTQPVFAGVGIPTTTPMTLAARLAFQRGSGGGVG
jgi:hypothetical protein